MSTNSAKERDSRESLFNEFIIYLGWTLVRFIRLINESSDQNTRKYVKM
jgi:hypothetical protein